MVLLISPKDAYATRRLAEEAGKLGMPIDIFGIKDLAAQNFGIDVKKYSALWVRFAYPYFNEIIELAKRFDDAGKFVVDRDFILDGFEMSKAKMYEVLQSNNLPIPLTNYELRIADYGFPIVLKWIYGFGGKHTYVVRNEDEKSKIIEKYPAGELLAQEYIEADAEYMVLAIGYKVLPVLLKFQISNFQFQINPYKYLILKSENYPQVIELAEKAAKATGREFAKVDILQKNNQVYILEVNRSASLLPFEPYSKINVAKEYLLYIKNKI